MAHRHDGNREGGLLTAEIWEPGTKQSDCICGQRGTAGSGGRDWLTCRALLEGSMAAERRTEGQEGEEEGGMNGRGSPVLMAMEMKQEGQIHKASQRQNEEHLVTEGEGGRERETREKTSEN